MKSLFNYDNKFMQMLMTMGDLIILNVLFFICCIPIVTIGAAQAGLYSGLRVLTDKEDDSSCAAAFFRGFKSGFCTITAAFSVMLVLIVLVGYTAASVVFFDMSGVSGAPVWLSVAGLCICAVFQTLICIFHSRFSCTLGQLFRNVWLIFLAHPLRCILITVLTWSPVIILLADLRVFMMLTPIILTLYYGFMFLLSNSIMKKPFDDLIKMFHEKNAPPQAQQPEALEQSEETEPAQ